MLFIFSTMITLAPFSAAVMAAVRPAPPAPIYDNVSVIVVFFSSALVASLAVNWSMVPPDLANAWVTASIKPLEE